MINTKRIFVITLVVLFTQLSVSAQSAEAFTKELQAMFRGYKTLQTSFIQSGNIMTGSAGKLFYKKDKKMRLELPNITIISDGVSVWNINKKEKKVIISKFKTKDASLLSLPDLIEKYPAISKCELLKTDKGYSLTLIPNGKNEAFKTAKLICDLNKTLTGIQIQNSSGNSMSVTLSQTKIDKEISDSQFSYSPKEGMKVIDLR